MTMLHLEDFLGNLENWIVANETTIKDMWPQRGGWEEWAKPEIFRYLTNVDPGYDMQREQYIFTNNKKVDFLFNHESQIQDRVAVEMKCQSFENYKGFSKGLQTDLSKFTHDLKPEYEGMTLAVVGIYFTEHGGDLPVSFSKKSVGNGEVGICWAVDLG